MIIPTLNQMLSHWINLSCHLFLTWFHRVQIRWRGVNFQILTKNMDTNILRQNPWVTDISSLNTIILLNYKIFVLVFIVMFYEPRRTNILINKGFHCYYYFIFFNIGIQELCKNRKHNLFFNFLKKKLVLRNIIYFFLPLQT